MIVVDANVVKDYFLEVVIGSNHKLTESSKEIFEQPNLQIFLDEGGIIEKEWKSTVEPEWFDSWFSDLLIKGKAITIPVGNYPDLIQKLTQLGFPINGKDKWYIRTAAEVSLKNSIGIIITEDLDFYNPKMKNTGGDKRIKILKSANPPIKKFLKKKNIIVLCVQDYISSFL